MRRNIRHDEAAVNRQSVGKSDPVIPGPAQGVGMTNLKETGRRVREMRDAAKLTQADLGAIVGVTRSAIAGIETGGDRAGIMTAIALADYFKVPLDWLLSRKPPPGGPLVGQFVESRDKLALLRFWESLDTPDRRALIRTLRIPGVEADDVA